MTEIPTLETPRLLLRPFVEADYPAYGAFLASQRSRYMGGPYDGWAAWGMFCHEIACWTLFGHGGLIIERRADGAGVGVVEINHGPLFPEKELGWMLYDSFEGQGYATEAAVAMRDWGFGQGISTLVSYVEPRNLASAAVARGVGGVLDPSAPRRDEEDLVFRYGAAG